MVFLPCGMVYFPSGIVSVVFVAIVVIVAVVVVVVVAVVESWSPLL